MNLHSHPELQARPLRQGSGRGVTAVLGPTNTGKTHLAIERMLAHQSGMIGLPLRLLAREVYNRVVNKVGPEQVALITGGSDGIGRATAELLAQRGATVIVCARGEEKLEATKGAIEAAGGSVQA